MNWLRLSRMLYQQFMSSGCEHSGNSSAANAFVVCSYQTFFSPENRNKEFLEEVFTSWSHLYGFNHFSVRVPESYVIACSGDTRSQIARVSTSYLSTREKLSRQPHCTRQTSRCRYLHTRYLSCLILLTTKTRHALAPAAGTPTMAAVYGAIAQSSLSTKLPSLSVSSSLDSASVLAAARSSRTRLRYWCSAT